MTDGTGFDIWGRLRVDSSELEEVPDKVKREIAGVDGQKATAKVHVDDRDAQAKIKGVRTDIARIDKTVATPKIKIDGSGADRTLADLKAHFARTAADIERTAIKVKTSGTGPANAGAAAGNLGAGGGMIATFGAGRAALAGAGITGAMVVAVPMAKEFYANTVAPARQEARIDQGVSRAFGADQAEVQAMAARLSEETGYAAADFEQAAIAAKNLASDQQLGRDSIAPLLAASADLAQVALDPSLRNVPGAFAALKGAIGGNEAAAQSLELDLSDKRMSEVTGMPPEVWAQMTDPQKTSARFTEALAQVGPIGGAASAESYDRNMRLLERSARTAAVAIGSELIPVIDGLAQVAVKFADAMPDWLPKLIGKGLTTYNPVMLRERIMYNRFGGIGGLGWGGDKERKTEVGLHVNVRMEQGMVLDAGSYAPENQ